VIRVALYRKLNMVQRVASFSAGQGISLSTSGSISEPDEIVLTIAATGGGGGTPATTVVSGTTPGLSPVVGVSTDYARGDHSHGTPTVPAHTALSALAWASSGHTGSATAVAAWDGGGTAAVVQATTDETMLVRRAGTLQWVPLVAAAVVVQQALSSDFALSVIDIGGIATT
tara:strand:+ start:1232 stop:1747 length:516 start_codon:yes stop_codon:yes gene_type:complete